MKLIIPSLTESPQYELKPTPEISAKPNFSALLPKVMAMAAVKPVHALACDVIRCKKVQQAIRHRSRVGGTQASRSFYAKRSHHQQRN